MNYSIICYNHLQRPFGYKPNTELLCRRVWVLWANTVTSTAPVATCSPALERARIQIPSHSHLLGDNSTNDSSVDKAGPFVSLLPDLIQSSAREKPDVTRHCHLPAGAASSGALQTLQSSPEGQSSSHLPGTSIWVEFGSPKHGLPPASFHLASIPPCLHFTRVGSPPSLVSWKELRSLCCCLHGLTSCSTKGCTSNDVFRDLCKINQMKKCRWTYKCHQGMWQYLILLSIKPFLSAS